MSNEWKKNLLKKGTVQSKHNLPYSDVSVVTRQTIIMLYKTEVMTPCNR